MGGQDEVLESGAGCLRPDEPDPGTDTATGGGLDTASSRVRWGHCGWASNGGACVWGGAPAGDPREVMAIGRGGGQKRERLLTTGECPSWREQHGCVSMRLSDLEKHNRDPRGNARAAGNAHVLFGGRRVGPSSDVASSDANNSTLLNDVHVIDDNFRWHPVRVTGAVPSPRAGHSMVAISRNQILCFGGVRDGNKRCQDTYVLQFEQGVTATTGTGSKIQKTQKDANNALHCAWRLVETTSKSLASRRISEKQKQNANPPAREAASLSFQPPCETATAGVVWMFGGVGGADGDTFLDDVWAFNVATEVWRQVMPLQSQLKSKNRPSARAGHTATVVPLDALFDVSKHDKYFVSSDSSNKSSYTQLVMVIHGGLGAKNQCFSDLWVFSFAARLGLRCQC